MEFKIHRGTKEIGGSCVEVWTENTRILLDFGMPLVGKDGEDFDFGKYKALNPDELVKQGVLPDISGLYDGTNHPIDGVIISHAHQDHYGLIKFINKDIQHYLGEATHKIIELNNLFTPQSIKIENAVFFEKEKPFQIGDFSITAYWADHSAFDAYAFLVEAEGKSIFYSGDFRNHGRKEKAFRWFTHNAPQEVDYLLLEGTTIGRQTKPFKKETEIEDELVQLFEEPGKTNLIYTSGQNIDRLVSIYKACLRSGKIMVVDVYVAEVLTALSPFGRIPYPSKNYSLIKVMFPYSLSKKLAKEGKVNMLYQFKNYKITKHEISDQSDKIVMVVRPSLQKDLAHIPGIDGGNLIYSLWEGYLQKPYTKNFVDYLISRNFTVHHVHTSGHADTAALKQLVTAINPKNIVPIHTFCGSAYKNIFSAPIVELNDGETKQVI